MPPEVWGSYQYARFRPILRTFSSPLEPDDGFCPTPLQEPAEVNGAEFSNNVRGQSFEDEFQFLTYGVKRIGHSEEDRVQSRPALQIDPRVDICDCHGEICLERDPVDASGGEGFEDWLDPVTRLSELDETESYLL